MADINGRPPAGPYWPWGGRRSIRERLVDPEQLERKQKARAKGDPKNPPLASTALLEFIGPGHSSEELRLPEPPFPLELEAELGGEVGLTTLRGIAGRADADQRGALERGLTQIRASPERVERMRALLRCESEMLQVMGELHEACEYIEKARREEQKEEGY